MHRIQIHILLLILLFPPISLFAAENNPVVARVNGAPIAQSELYGEYQRLIPLNTYHRRITPKIKNNMMKRALQNLIVKELKLQDAKRLGLSIPESDLNAALQKVIDSYHGRQAYEKQLQQWHVSEEEVRESVRKKELVTAAYKAEVTDKVHVNETIARKYYDQNKKRFIQPLRMHLREILIKVPALSTSALVEQKRQNAEKIIKEIKAGLPFEEAAAKYSDAPNQERGGDMGLVHKGVLEPEAEKAVLAGKAGEIFGPFKGFRGFVILKLEKTLPEKQMTFDEVKAGLIQDLKRKETNDLTEAWMDRLHKEAKIEILDPRFKDKKPVKEKKEAAAKGKSKKR